MKEIVDYKKGIIEFSNYSLGLELSALDAKPGPGEWSTAETLMHILDVDFALSDRMKRVTSEVNPSLIKFDEKKFLERLYYKSDAIETATKLFIANREMMIFHLEKLTVEDFLRKGIHSVKGEQTLLEILSFASWHLDHHGKFILGKRKNLGMEFIES